MSQPCFITGRTRHSAAIFYNLIELYLSTWIHYDREADATSTYTLFANALPKNGWKCRAPMRTCGRNNLANGRTLDTPPRFAASFLRVCIALHRAASISQDENKFEEEQVYIHSTHIVRENFAGNVFSKHEDAAIQTFFSLIFWARFLFSHVCRSI